MVVRAFLLARALQTLEEVHMLVPDEKLGADILDALDDRCVSVISPHVYGQEIKLERCWAEQQYHMVQALLGWLDRKMPASQEDPRLRQAAGVLRDHLASAGRELDHTIQQIDQTVDRRLQSRWEGDRS